jgi:hypothetical protein
LPKSRIVAFALIAKLRRGVRLEFSVNQLEGDDARRGVEA